MPSASMLSFACQAKQLDQGLTGRSQCVPRRHRASWVSTSRISLSKSVRCFDTGGVPLVGDLEYRRVDGIDRDAADFGARSAVHHGRDVAAARRRPARPRACPCRSASRCAMPGLCTVNPAGGTMSPAVTHRPLLCAGYIVTGSSSSEDTTRPLRFQNDAGDIFFDTRHRGEIRAARHRLRNAGDGRAGNRRQQRNAAANCPGCSRIPAPAAR